MKKKYFIRQKERVNSGDFYDKIRNSLKLTKEQLPDKTINKVVVLNNSLIGQWIIDNPDGFKIKDNGILVVSKWMPPCFRGDRDETIEKVKENPKLPAEMKDMIIKRYTKSINYYRDFHTGGKHVNLHSFFYLYRIMWFNNRNCNFDKAECYEFVANNALKMKVNEKVVSGKDYFEWDKTDHRERKRDKITPEKRIAKEKRKAKQLELLQNKETINNE